MTIKCRATIQNGSWSEKSVRSWDRSNKKRQICHLSLHRSLRAEKGRPFRRRFPLPSESMLVRSESVDCDYASFGVLRPSVFRDEAVRRGRLRSARYAQRSSSCPTGNAAPPPKSEPELQGRIDAALHFYRFLSETVLHAVHIWLGQGVNHLDVLDAAGGRM